MPLGNEGFKASQANRAMALGHLPPELYHQRSTALLGAPLARLYYSTA